MRPVIRLNGRVERLTGTRLKLRMCLRIAFDVLDNKSNVRLPRDHQSIAALYCFLHDYATA